VVTLAQAVAKLDQRCSEGEVRRWLQRTDEESVLEARADIAAAASRARGWALVREDRLRREEERRCR